MADVFISYSSKDRPLIHDLAAKIEALGATVWWDARLVAGRPFRPAITSEIDAARLAIVVWTETSVRSRWVVWEAARADKRQILITLRTPTLRQDHVPPPFGELHTPLVTDWDAIKTALRPLKLKPLHSDAPDPATTALPGWSTRRKIVAGVAVLASGAAAGSFGLSRLSVRSAPTPLAWSQLPAGTHLENRTSADIATYDRPDRSSSRSSDIRAWTAVPAKDVDDLLWQADIGGEPWIRIPLGPEGRFRHVPTAAITVTPPS